MENGKIALITGASYGIGFSLAKELSSRGYQLVLVSRDMDRLETAKKEINSSKNTECIAIDLSEQGSALHLYNTCKEKGLNVHILVNNAGVGAFGDSTSLSADRVENMLMLNIVNLTMLCRYFGEHMMQQKSGYILNVASTAGYTPIPRMASYAASKSYVLNFSLAIAHELKGTGIVVSCLAPGLTDTKFFENASISEKNLRGLGKRMNPDMVAKSGIDNMFKKKASYVPGLANRVLASTTRFTPRALLFKITDSLTKE